MADRRYGQGSTLGGRPSARAKALAGVADRGGRDYCPLPARPLAEPSRVLDAVSMISEMGPQTCME